MTGPRRSPPTAGRLRDAERTKAALIEAALVEFGTKGLAGARVSEIAERAGVNKQLISYYFGGKEGLYQQILRDWSTQEQELAEPGGPLADLAVRYLRAGHDQRDLQRLFIRQSMDESLGDWPDDVEDRDVEFMQERKEAGDLGADIDPGFALLFMQAMVISSVVFPGDVRRLTGLEPGSPEYLEKAAEQLRHVVERLA